MKLIALAGLALLAPFGFRAATTAEPAVPAAASAYAVDAVHSSVVFRIKHVVAPFWGRFNKLEGKLAWDAAAPEKSSIEMSVDVGSIDTADENRDQHLRGPEFFAAKEFPKMTFKSTKVAKKSEGKLEVTGDLTLHGVTKPVTAQVEFTGEGPFDPMQDYRAGFEATFEFKRTDFGVSAYAPMISDEVRVIVALECIREEGKEKK